MTYFLPFWAAQKEIEITFIMTFGAGMFAIAPDSRIVVHFAVDYSTSPPFQVLLKKYGMTEAA
jgi:hypothetical protein